MPDDDTIRLAGTETPVCPRCFQPVEGAPTFCQHCTMPLSFVATAGPFESEVGAWRALGDAATRPAPPLIVRVGFWTLFGAMLAGPLAAAIATRQVLPLLVYVVLGALLLYGCRRARLRAAVGRGHADRSLPESDDDLPGDSGPS